MPFYGCLYLALRAVAAGSIGPHRRARHFMVGAMAFVAVSTAYRSPLARRRQGAHRTKRQGGIS